MVQNKIVLITGASSGIGLVTAVQLAEQGYIVFASSRRGNSSVNLPNLHFVQADVNDKDQMKNVIELIVKQYKKLMLLFVMLAMELQGQSRTVVVMKFVFKWKQISMV